MLRTIYRAFVIGRTRSAAEQIANKLSVRQLQDIGYSRFDFVESQVTAVTNELNAAEIKRKNNAIRYPNKTGLWVIYKYFNLRSEA
jgi:hypothetical protein